MAIFTALSAITAFVSTTLVSAGLSAAAAAAGANFIVGTGLSLISTAFAPKAPKLSIPDGQAVLNQTTGPRIRGYGIDKLGGTRAFWEGRDGRLYQIVMLHSGRISEFLQFWIGDTRVDVNDVGHILTKPFRQEEGTAATIDTRAGLSGSTAYQQLIDVFPRVWTAEHRLRGVATLFVVFGKQDAEKFSKAFPDGANSEVTAVCKLSPVYDPRRDLTEWSDNPSLGIRDYLIHPDGYPGIEGPDVNNASFAAFADVCDLLAPKKGGGFEKRYRMSGTYSLQDDPADILRAMRLCCDAELYEDADGLICIRGGAWTAPTVTIEDKDVLSFDMVEGNDRFAAFNELKIVFKDPKQGYKSNEAPKWVNFADQARRGVVVDELTLPFCPSPSQAQRLAKIHERKSNPRFRGAISTNLVGLKARGERIIRLRLPEIGIDDTFLLETHGIRADLTGCDMTLIALDASAYEWDPEAEERDASPEPGDTRPDPGVEIPALTLAIEQRELTSATTASVVVATAAVPGAEEEPAAEDEELTLLAEIRVDPDGPWLGMIEDGPVAVSGAVAPRQSYAVRARWVTAADAVSEWSEPLSITIP